MKNVIAKSSNRKDRTEERTSKLEDVSIKTSPNEIQRKRMIKKMKLKEIRCAKIVKIPEGVTYK